MGKYSTKNYQLTEKEEAFIKAFLASNGCGAGTPEVLLGDNFSCKCMEDLTEELEETYSPHEIAGFISSLESKGVLNIEDERGDEIVHTKRGLKRKKLPDLYWVNKYYLEELDADLDFYAEGK